jgi:hypothetical protein
MSSPPVYIPEQGVRVCREKCSTCIFRPGNLMHLHEGRLKQIVEQTREDDAGNIVCHQTLDQKQGAICRGFYDAYGEGSMILRLARMLDAIVEVDPGEKGSA